MDMHLFYFSRPILHRMLEHAGYEVIHVAPYRHYALLNYIFWKGAAIMPVPIAAVLRQLGRLIPSSITIPVSIGDIKLFIARKQIDE